MVLHRHAAKCPVACFRVARRAHKFSDHVINVNEGHFVAAVVDGYGQVVGDIIAEGRHGAVIIRATPFAEHVGKTVDKHLGAGFFRIAEKQILPRLFAFAVGV